MVGSATGWSPTRGGNSGEREELSSEISIVTLVFLASYYYQFPLVVDPFLLLFLNKYTFLVRIARGSNECQIEEFVLGAWPQEKKPVGGRRRRRRRHRRQSHF